MKFIALFGGSFDPPHIGHVAVVDALLKRDDVERVIIMPAYLNPFKESSFAPSSLRLKWLREIFSAYESVEISEYEVKQEKKVTSIETVEYLLQKSSNIYLVIGADNVANFHKWHRYDELVKKVKVVVASRDNLKVEDNFIILPVNEDISSSFLRENLIESKLPKQCANEIKQYYKENNAKKS